MAKHRSPPRLPNLLKDETGPGDRARLSFEALAAHSPEIALRATILRDRVGALRSNFARDMADAYHLFRQVTRWTLMAGAAGVVLALVFATRAGTTETTSALSVVGVGIAGMTALLGAASRAYGYHQRYRALFGGYWAMTGLAAAIDQGLHEIALDVPEGEALPPDARTRLTTALEGWTERLLDALTRFGEQYGASLTPVAAPSAGKLP